MQEVKELKFFQLPFDKESVDFLESQDVELYKNSLQWI